MRIRAMTDAERDEIKARIREGREARKTTADVEGCPSAKATAIASQIIDYLEDDARLDTVAGDVIAIARIIEVGRSSDASKEYVRGLREAWDAAIDIVNQSLDANDAVAKLEEQCAALSQEGTKK